MSRRPAAIDRTRTRAASRRPSFQRRVSAWLLGGRSLFLDLALGSFEVEDVGLALFPLVLVVVEILEAEDLVRREGRQFFLFVGTEQTREGLRLRPPLELSTTGLQPRAARAALPDDALL